MARRLTNGAKAHRLSRNRMGRAKPLPASENPHAAIPSSVLEQIAGERLPPTKEAYQARLNELLAALQQENTDG